MSEAGRDEKDAARERERRRSEARAAANRRVERMAPGERLRLSREFAAARDAADLIYRRGGLYR